MIFVSRNPVTCQFIFDSSTYMIRINCAFQFPLIIPFFWPIFARPASQVLRWPRSFQDSLVVEVLTPTTRVMRTKRSMGLLPPTEHHLNSKANNNNRSHRNNNHHSRPNRHSNSSNPLRRLLWMLERSLHRPLNK